MTRIKISGLTQPGDAEVAARQGAHMVACVFNSQSPRYVTIEQAWAIRRSLPGQVALAGVFVDTPTAVVQMVANSCHLDLIQLFGHETRAEVDALGPMAFKAVTAEDSEAVEAAIRTFIGRRPRRLDGPVLELHLAGTLSAGWELAASAAARGPLVLAAGALDPDSVFEVIRWVRPWAVDVWDAVESSPGHLDAARLEAFVTAVHAADAALAAITGKETPP